MPIYEYRCADCGNEHSESLSIRAYEQFQSNHGIIVCNCGTEMHRVFSPVIKSSMPEHYNTSVGQFIRTERELKDVFKRQSEEATIRTGIEHNFVPVSSSDRKTLGVTSEGLDATYNRRRELGMRTNDAMRIND